MTRRQGMLRRLRLFLQGVNDTDLDDELQFHVDMAMEANLAEGMSPGEARRRALATFGGVQQVKEECRELRATAWLEHLLTDVRYSLRSLRRSPLFALVVIGTLTLGIGATTTLYSLVESVLLKPLPYRDPDQLVFLTERAPQGREIAVAPANFLDWQRQAQSFEGMAAATPIAPVLQGQGEPERLVGARVSANYFAILGSQPALGRTFMAEDDRPDGPAVVILSHDLWARRFGRDPTIVGRTIHLGHDPCTVIGVMPRGFATARTPYDPQAADLWRPYPFANNSPGDRDAHLLQAVARLKAGTSLQQAQEEMNVIAGRLQAAYPQTNKALEARVLPMRDRLVRDTRRPITILFGAVCFILVIVCVNIAALLAARGRARHAEMAMRRALGATRVRLVRQLLTESLVLCVLGGAGGVLLAWALIPAMVAASPWALPFFSSAGLSVPVLLFAVATCAGTGVLVGLVPALRNANPDLTGELATGARGSTTAGKIRGSGTLVVAEVALALMLLTGAGLLLNSYRHITHVELGFQPDDVTVLDVRVPQKQYAVPIGRGGSPETEGLTVWQVQPRQAQFVEEVVERLRQIPGVSHAAAINDLPATNTGWRGPVRANGTPPPKPPEMIFGFRRPVTGEYFETMHIPLLAGRRFDAADQRGDDDIAIVDEALARKLWPSASPLGKAIVIQDGRADRPHPFRIIGVVGSVRMLDFERDALGYAVAADDRFFPNTVYLPYRRQSNTYVDFAIASRMHTFFVVGSADGTSIPVADLRRVVRRVEPESLVTIRSLTGYLGETMGEQRFLAQLVAAFGILGLVLAVTGIYGVVGYSVTRRVREVGIRMVLGARRVDIMRMFVTHVLRHAAIGLVLGVAGALAVGRVLSGFLYQVTPRDPGTLLGAAAFLLTAAVLAAWIPSRRAARSDPSDTMRAE